MKVPAGAQVYKAFLYWNIVDETRQARHERYIPEWQAGNGQLYRRSSFALLDGNADRPILTGRM